MKYSPIMLWVTAAVALAQAPTSLPPGEKGTLSSSGKFQPAAQGEKAQAAEPEVKKLTEDTYSVGRVVLDKKQRTVTFPAKLNMRENLIEYAIVTPQGKRHEALLTSEASPKDIHVACLLLGVAEVKVDGAPDKDAPVPAANAVNIDVTWETNGPAVCRPLEQMIGQASGGSQDKVEKTLSIGPWFYNGSVVEATGFAAQSEGSIVSLIRDSSALMNNPRADRDNDKVHVPNTAALPPDGMPLKVILRFAAAPKTAAK